MTRYRELLQRERDGLAITLLWLNTDNSVHIRIEDQREYGTWQFQVPNESAMDAFDHPFVFRPDTLSSAVA